MIQLKFGSINLSTEMLSSQIINKSHPINPFDNSDRLFVLSKISFRSISGLKDHENYPNIGFGYKISKNLALEGSILNKPLDNSLNQAITGGVQYFFGTADTLSWVTSVKKSSFSSIKEYNVNSITFDISKWINFRSKLFKFGFGSSFYKKNDFSINSIGQINFTFMNILVPVKKSQLGFGLEINQNTVLNSFFVQRSFK